MTKAASELTTCPQCAEGLVFPRDLPPYCDECGWPEENLLLSDLEAEDAKKALVLYLDKNEPDTSPVAYLEQCDETGSWSWVAVTSYLPMEAIGSGNGDELAEVAFYAMECMHKYAEKVRVASLTCPDCGRLKAADANDVARGHCSKWIPTGTTDDCHKHRDSVRWR